MSATVPKEYDRIMAPERVVSRDVIDCGDQAESARVVGPDGEEAGPWVEPGVTEGGKVGAGCAAGYSSTAGNGGWRRRRRTRRVSAATISIRHPEG